MFICEDDVHTFFIWNGLHNVESDSVTLDQLEKYNSVSIISNY